MRDCRRAGGRRSRRGAVSLEYILVCALLVLVGTAGVPAAIRIMGSAFEVILAVVGSPHPSLF